MTQRGEVQGDQPTPGQQAPGVKQPLYLSIDQGGHASRVIVFDQAGRMVAEAHRSVAVSRPRPDRVEQDADALVASVQAALGECLQTLGARCRDIVAAGLVTQRSNIVCWDRDNGRALSPAISWQDRRGQPWLQDFVPHTERIRRITGLLPSAHYGASKIHWCLEQLEAVAAARRQGTLVCGPLASFLLFRLLKERPLVVDSVNASRTLLWDRRTRQWSDELLGLFGLAADYLPRCVPNRHDFGSLAVTDGFSIPLSIPLTVCSGDQSAALFAMGMPAVGCAYLNMGTGAFLQCVTPPEQVLPARLLQSVVWHEPGALLQVLEATVNGAGSALTLVEKELGISARQAQNQAAHWLATADRIPLYLNGVSGLGSPFWRADFVSRFVGDEAETAEPGAKWVAVLESILFLLRINLEELGNEAVDVQQIVLSGGLSVLDGLCQRLADLSGLPVERLVQREASAQGLAFLLASPPATPVTEGADVAEDWVTDHGFAGDWAAENVCERFAPAANPALLDRYACWRRALQAELDRTPAS